MKKLAFLVFLTTCIITPRSYAQPASLGWWFLPDTIEELPIELEEDDSGFWTELWLRPGVDSTVAPNEVMEQGLGVRWMGMLPDKDGLPTNVVLVLGGTRIVDFKGPATKFGIISQDHIQWNDNTADDLYAFRRRHRRRRSAKINFGKIVLPPLASKTKNLSDWSVERLTPFLETVSEGPIPYVRTRDLSAVAQVYDQNGSFLNFNYDASCTTEERAQIEDVLALEVEPRLTCWMEQNREASARLLAALLQKPVIKCKGQSPMTSDHCGMASLPYANGFFITNPVIHVAMDRCKGELGQTLLHETLHLAGIKDAEIDPALTMAESCQAFPTGMEYENDNEGFFNDFEVQTRIFLFRKIRDEAVDKWHWREGERDFVLGSICAKMGDKYCSRNYFQKAAEEGLQGMVTLPEGTSVTWSSLAQFEFYDFVTEDLQRMHELSRYLKRDPNGTLLRRIETGIHRLHEFFVARQALEAVKNNKGICSSETDEHIFCEDLLEIKKTPWFNRP